MNQGTIFRSYARSEVPSDLAANVLLMIEIKLTNLDAVIYRRAVDTLRGADLSGVNLSRADLSSLPSLTSLVQNLLAQS